MQIAILLAGHTNKAMAKRFVDYPDMFENLFKDLPLGGVIQRHTFAVIDDIFPDNIDDFDGFLITGSAYGVYDDAPFITKLTTLIQQIHAAGKPLVGICFGHQIIAHALGGFAAKSAKGWGLGTSQINLSNLPDWIKTDRQDINLIHVHQDQVETLPATAQRIASTPFCKNAAYIIGDTVLAFQGHPEFDAEYTSALIDLIALKAGPEKAATAQVSLAQPNHGKTVGNWILAFFAQHALAPDAL